MSMIEKWYANLSGQEAKDGLDDEMKNIKKSFVAAGFYLKIIRDNEFYKEDGYGSIWEFAQSNYGISKSTASRWMAINDKFSKDGNSPILEEKYEGFEKSQLQEMLYLDDKQIEQVTPGMTTKEIRDIRKPEPEKRLSKPDESQVEYLKAAAKHIILCNHKWFLDKHLKRALNVITSPEELKQKLGPEHRTWYFATEKGTAHINLFDEYVQLWDEKSDYMGDFDWLYFARAIQVMWTIIALEKAEEERKAKDQEKQAPTQCIHVPEFACTLSEAQKAAAGDGVNCSEKCCWNCHKRNECGYACNASGKNPLHSVFPECEATVATSQQEEIPGQMKVYDYPELIPEKMQEVIETGNKEIQTDTVLTYLVEAVMEEFNIEKIFDEAEVFKEDKYVFLRDELFAKVLEFEMQGMNLCGDFLEKIRVYLESETIGEYLWYEFFEELERVAENNEKTNEESFGIQGVNVEFELDLLKKILQKENKLLEDILQCYDKSDPVAAEQKIKVTALANLLCEWDKEDFDLPEEEQEQPELPLMKNNEQRKKFLETYQTWPIWFDVPEASETYHRYDLPDGSSIVICEYFEYRYWKEKYTDETPVTRCCKEFLLKPGYRYLHDCVTNQTALIEHLKAVQKGEKK